MLEHNAKIIHGVPKHQLLVWDVHRYARRGCPVGFVLCRAATDDSQGLVAEVRVGSLPLGWWFILACCWRDRDPDWKVLCDFLGLPVPKVPFPAPKPEDF
jgi:hypothetical protein